MDEDLEQDPVKLKRHIRLQSSKQRPTHSKAWLIANRIAPKEVEQWTALSKEHTKVAKEVIRCTSVIRNLQQQRSSGPTTSSPAEPRLPAPEAPEETSSTGVPSSKQGEEVEEQGMEEPLLGCTANSAIPSSSTPALRRRVVKSYADDTCHAA